MGGREGWQKAKKKKREKKGGHNLWAAIVILLEGNGAQDRFLLRDSAQGGDFMLHQWAHLYILNQSNNHKHKAKTHLVIHTEGSNPFRREYRVLHTSRTQLFFRIPSICQTEHQKKARTNNKRKVKHAKRTKNRNIHCWKWDAINPLMAETTNPRSGRLANCSTTMESACLDIFTNSWPRNIPWQLNTIPLLWTDTSSLLVILGSFKEGEQTNEIKETYVT